MGKKAKNGSSGRVAELKRPLGERDRVIGELTVANRGGLPAGRALPSCALFATRRGKKGAGDSAGKPARC